jgi:ABC-2 type transport system permease protein
VLIYKVARSIRIIFGFAWLNGVIAAKRNPLWVISYLITPFSLLVLFFVWGGESLARNAVIGGLVSMAAMNGIGLMGDVAYYKNFVKLQDMMVASPMTALHYMLGLALSGFLFSTPGLLLMLLFAGKLIGLSIMSLLVIIIVYIMLLLSTAGIGFTVATFVREERYVWPLSNILSFGLMILPPVYYPYTLLPSSLVGPAVTLPTSNAAMILQYITGLIPKLPYNIAALLAILGAETVVFLWISLKKSQWREK